MFAFFLGRILNFYYFNFFKYFNSIKFLFNTNFFKINNNEQLLMKLDTDTPLDSYSLAAMARTEDILGFLVDDLNVVGSKDAFKNIHRHHFHRSWRELR